MSISMNRVNIGLGGGSLLQPANRSHIQMMSYIIDTPNGEVIVIDGGNWCVEDGEYLYEQLQQRGGRVSLWFITHAHKDHYGALAWILENRDINSIVIDKLCFHFPPKEWLLKKEDTDYYLHFEEVLRNSDVNIVTTNAGEMYSCDGISVEVINDPIVKDGYQTINSTGIIILVHFPNKDILFLGDFDVYSQEEFLEKYDVSKIRKDIVQMAHHGQNGVNKAFYELINPKVCLYTAPIWLWDNYKDGNDPETAGMGCFTTLETRRWMNEMGVEMSCVHAFGDYLFT